MLLTIRSYLELLRRGIKFNIEAQTKSHTLSRFNHYEGGYNLTKS